MHPSARDGAGARPADAPAEAAAEAAAEERRRAAALSYNAGRDSAPRVIGAGAGALAERIVAVARANGVPVVRDDALAAALAALPVGSEIPPALYEAVAQVLAYIYAIDRSAPARPTGRR